MIVRLRFGRGRRIERKTRKNRHVALAAATLLSPAALTSYALGAWRLGADLDITGEFAIRRGLFSHWQVWIGLGAGLNVLAVALNRYGHNRRIMPHPRQCPVGRTESARAAAVDHANTVARR